MPKPSAGAFESPLRLACCARNRSSAEAPAKRRFCARVKRQKAHAAEGCRLCAQCLYRGMSKIDLYEPIGVIKPVAPDIWIADGPIEHMDYALGLKFPFPTRMAVIRLPSGELFVWSPIAASEELYAQVAALGAVAHLVSP